MLVPKEDRIAMSQRERDVLKVIQGVVDGKRSQAEAAVLLRLSSRQVRRLQRKLESQGDGALVHGLRGKPSNHRCDTVFRTKVLRAYRRRYSDFGPTFACEKLAEENLIVSAETLRSWLLAEGLWQRQRRRDTHRQRRPRRACFGELVQMDTSLHDWLEGRGEEMVLLTMIDDATSRQMARFYPSDTIEAHFDLVERWMKKYGRPLALYTDRHGIFESHKKGQPDYAGETQFSRALAELEIELIKAHSPQAKGRVERSFGTAQDRWVKELRLAKAKTLEQANAVLEWLIPDHNRRFSTAPREASDAHRSLGHKHRLEAILSIQEERVVSNDYTIRYKNRFYQLLKPVYPGERGGRVVIEERRNGTMAIRFRSHYLKYLAIGLDEKGEAADGSEVEFNAFTADASATKRDRDSLKKPRSPGIQPTGGRSGRTPAEPYPPDGEEADSPKPSRRPAENHPWRKKMI
jgi:Helix-turn-helix domain